VKQLFLFHHDPDHYDNKMTALSTEAEEQVATVGSAMRVSAAREGVEYVLEWASPPA
jgi:hypothetical protein